MIEPCKLEVMLTCNSCASAINIYPNINTNSVKCEICKSEQKVIFSEEHVNRIVKSCPSCLRKDIYSQKDFNRKLGVSLFVIAAILSIFTYGISFIVLYLFDLILFKKLKKIAICYKCETIFRNAKNIDSIPPYNHEMNDRIVYKDEDFNGEVLDH